MNATQRRVVTVTAPSRLHFGLLAFGEGHKTQFGGVGLMIDRPGTTLRLSHSDRLVLQVSDEPRVRQALAAWIRYVSLQWPTACAELSELPIQIRQIAGPPSHVGLGSGTQLSLAVAIGLHRWFETSPGLAPSDAAIFGRAKRSAIGSHGFFIGGLIVDQGKTKYDSVGSLETRIELPQEWRVVLACPRGDAGPCGELEETLFASLPPVKMSETESLRAIVRERLIPAGRAGDFNALGQAIYEFGYRAGLCFGSWQNGPFNGPRVRELVEFIRSRDVSGTGQSSWGPCVFALCPSEHRANELLVELQKRFPTDDVWFEVSTLNQHGYEVSDCGNQTITRDNTIHRA